MRFGIFVKPDRQDFAGRLRDIFDWLIKRGCQVFLDSRLDGHFSHPGVISAKAVEIPRLVDMVVVFGGDGTLLSVSRLVGGERTPILGVNLGTLGFLAGVTLDELYAALDSILAGQYRLDSRGMLKAEIKNGTDGWTCYHALNDIVINKGALARMISVDVWINGDFTSQFLADGIILSTPTGSTAYSLSAGGPIIYPELSAVTLTPICPHTLTHRPLVIPAEVTVSLVLKRGEDVTVTMDGQVGVALEVGAEVRCSESEYRVQLVQPTTRSFFDVLRQKLKWGERWQSR